MRNVILAASAVVAAGLATPAFAQDQTNPNFTGPRVGVIAGYDGIQPGSSTGVSNSDHRVNGFLYGVDAGYDIALGGAVIGIEGEYSDSTGKVNNNTSAPNYFGFGRVAADRDLYIGARAGILASPTTMLYVKGGYTNAKLDTVAANGAVSQEAAYKLEGWRAGAGVEHAMSTNTYAKLEYRYSNYNDARFRYPSGATTGTYNIDTDRHQVVVGVGMRF